MITVALAQKMKNKHLHCCYCANVMCLHVIRDCVRKNSIPNVRYSDRLKLLFACLFSSIPSSFDVFKFIAVKCTSNERICAYLPIGMLTMHKRHRFPKCENFSINSIASTELLAIRRFHMHSKRNAWKNTFEKGTYHSLEVFSFPHYFLLLCIPLSLSIYAFFIRWNIEIAMKTLRGI